MPNSHGLCAGLQQRQSASRQCNLHSIAPFADPAVVRTEQQEPAQVQPGLPAAFGGPASPGPIRVGPRSGAVPQDTGRLACAVPATPWTARFKRQLDTMDPSEWARLTDDQKSYLVSGHKQFD